MCYKSQQHKNNNNSEQQLECCSLKGEVENAKE